MAAAPPPSASQRRSYAQRVDELADKINRIALMHAYPHALAERRDEASRECRRIAAALRADGL
ncbi:hypothetical protein [Sandarakinorhabdus sp.]|uniref:hypothetical protein n=1 Tax=Sandarakinorhabdus sp. TaxID=1916663 RepID=UPI00286DE41C|nr:hypothetical protein [Sandarakinorhabdus sp.]